MAGSGKIPVATTFAVFAAGRAFDQLRQSVALQHANVKVVASHAGLTVGEDGKSAQALEDLALMCSLLGFNVVVPADSVEAAQATAVAVATDGPFYIRTGRPAVPFVYDPSHKFVLGKAFQHRDGADVTLIACGIMVKAAIDAGEALAKEGIQARVLNMATLAPLDEAAILAAANDTGAIEHTGAAGIRGGEGPLRPVGQARRAAEGVRPDRRRHRGRRQEGRGPQAQVTDRWLRFDRPPLCGRSSFVRCAGIPIRLACALSCR